MKRYYREATNATFIIVRDGRIAGRIWRHLCRTGLYYTMFCDDPKFNPDRPYGIEIYPDGELHIWSSSSIVSMMADEALEPM